MVYHSEFNEAQARQLCSMALLPIKTKVTGPAAQCPPDQRDIIDEALDFFKANVLFRNFEIQGPADRLLIYLTWYTKEALGRLNNCSRGDAEKQLYQLAIENFSIPGDSQFPFGGFFSNPTGRAEADQTRKYFTQLRHELGSRLIERVYAESDAAPSKWWMCWVKRKFLGH